MKVTVPKTPVLKAVVCEMGTGIFLRHHNETIYIGVEGKAMHNPTSLETAAERAGRTPVYEGQTITITF